MIKGLCALIFLLLLSWQGLWCQTTSVRNQFSAELRTYQDKTLPDAELGVLWQPDLAVRYPFSALLSATLELSAQSRLRHVWADEEETSLDITAYRYALKLDTPATELRVGLQRISFGSAILLRPLQWFDSLIPSDKLEQTAGVKAILARHYFANNANLWAWGILGQDDPKGNESLAGKASEPEWGGRLQSPNPLGETALSFHQRKLGVDGFKYENRIGIDHRYDGAIGAWLETSGSSFVTETGVFDVNAQTAYQVSSSIGGNYTIGIGRGLALTLETAVYSQMQNSISKLQRDAVHTALMANYPLGLLDTMILLGTWNWTEDTCLLGIIWRRTYDYLGAELYLSLDSGMPVVQSKSPSVGLKLSYDI